MIQVLSLALLQQVARPPIILRVRSAVRERISTFFSLRDNAMILSSSASSFSIPCTSSLKQQKTLIPFLLSTHLSLSLSPSPPSLHTYSTNLLQISCISPVIRYEECHVLFVDIFLKARIAHRVRDGLLFVDALREEEGMHLDLRPLLHVLRQFIKLIFPVVKEEEEEEEEDEDERRRREILLGIANLMLMRRGTPSNGGRYSLCSGLSSVCTRSNRTLLNPKLPGSQKNKRKQGRGKERKRGRELG